MIERLLWVSWEGLGGNYAAASESGAEGLSDKDGFLGRLSQVDQGV